MSVSERPQPAANVYEFFLVSAQEVERLDNAGGQVPAELDISAQQLPPQEQDWQARLSQLPTSSAVVYQGWHKPFVLEGLPTKRRASYIINVLTSKQQDLPPSELYEIEQVVRALVDAGIDSKLFQAKFVISKTRALDYEKWNSRNKW